MCESSDGAVVGPIDGRGERRSGGLPRGRARSRLRSDDSNHKIYYQGDVRAAITSRSARGDNRITIGGRTVSEASLPDGDRYKIYFEAMDPPRGVKYRVVEEERVR